MAFIRITQRGFVGMTGDLGGVQFKDGVSVESLNRFQIDRLASAFGIEDADNGDMVGPVARIISGRSVPAKAPEKRDQASEKQLAGLLKSAQAEAPKPSVPEFLTLDQVQAIADKQGIAGLRDVAKPLGVKGRSIPDLIEAIMKAQDEVREARVATSAPVAPEPVSEAPAVPEEAPGEPKTPASDEPEASEPPAE